MNDPLHGPSRTAPMHQTYRIAKMIRKGVPERLLRKQAVSPNDYGFIRVTSNTVRQTLSNPWRQPER